MKTNNDYIEIWNDLKSKHTDALLLFRTGDFYMLYGNDAIEANRILGVEMSQDSNGVEITGFPYMAIDVYLPKLVKAGKRIAICESLLEIVNQRVLEMA